MKNIMLDLETLGTAADAVIVSIGAVFFDVTGLGDKVYIPINIDSSIAAGRTVTAGTILFWLRQSKEAQDATFKLNEKALSLPDALQEFRKFVARAQDDNVTVWGMGSDFDCAMLSDAYARCRIRQPWKYSASRCFRTLKALYPDVTEEERTGVYHNALDDAVTQAEHAVRILCKQDLRNDHAARYMELSE